jgi:hypothetical protein
MWLISWLVVLVVPIAIFARSSFAAPQAPNSADVPVVKGGAGPCTADFVVKDPSGKGIYNAKIEVHIRYGLFGAHHLDATVGTNVDGKARMEGLPLQIRKTAEFQISYGGQSKDFPYDPLDNCHPQHEVVLGEK